MNMAVEPLLIVALAPAITAIILHVVWRSGPCAMPATVALMAFTFGIAGAKIRTEFVKAPIISERLYGVEVAGFIERIEPRSTRGPRVTVAVMTLGRPHRTAQPRRIRVRFLKPIGGILPGDGIRFKATLSPPSLPTLPGDYDFARAAFFQGLGAVGFSAAPPQLAPDLGPPPLVLRVWSAVQRLRQVIGEKIIAAIPGETGALANALMTGERGRVSAATLEAYRDSGLLHILSISGLHMAIMGGSVFVLIRFILAAFPSFALRYPIKKIAAGIAVGAAFSYLVISGTAYATIRAFIMIIIMLLAVALDRPAIALRNVAIAALVILVLVPESLFNVGFQMSFAAVIALVAAYEAWRDARIRRRGGREHGQHLGTLWIAWLFIAGIAGSTLVAGTAVAPFAAFHFHKSQQYSVLANLFAIPICNFVVMPAALASFVALPFGLEAWPLWVMGKGIDAMTWSARTVAALPGAVGRVPAFSTHAFGIMLIGGLWLCIWRGRIRLLGIIAIVVGVALAPFQARPDILIGRDGTLVALRGPDGRLAALPSRGGTFELQRWLEHDGDGRSPAEAQKYPAGSNIYRCDRAGCTARLKSRLVAVSRHPRALDDDCRRADVLILNMPKPPGCVPRGHVVDKASARKFGTHAIYIASNGAIRVQTVADGRGRRPWSEAGFTTPRKALAAIASAPTRWHRRRRTSSRPDIEET
ncbi:MAG TPA: ComEC/Rec2 family competence protein, partial [Hyphomicrobiaceae bacterium]|nr:ComEC/Rec2 family competence protein [Hyphomicrobiaceae bacterium]